MILKRSVDTPHAASFHRWALGPQCRYAAGGRSLHWSGKVGRRRDGVLYGAIGALYFLLAVKVLNLVDDSQVVIDMGSTKQELCEVIAQHPRRGRFVATHPMWGTEYSGPDAASRGAFAGRTAVICERERSDRDAVETVERLYGALGMPLVSMEPEEHDLHTAYVSHISHITSFALALTVLEKEREEQHIFDLAGGGFESTVRLAKSAPRTWVPILLRNKYNVLDVLREHIHQLQIMRRMIERDDAEGLTAAMQRANAIQKILP